MRKEGDKPEKGKKGKRSRASVRGHRDAWDCSRGGGARDGKRKNIRSEKQHQLAALSGGGEET